MVVRYYAVAELDVQDPGWVRDYVAEVTPMVERRGGRYLARSAQIEQLEGERPLPQILLIIEWPSREAAAEFYESKEYRPYRERRRAGARNEFRLVAGDDINRVAKIAGDAPPGA
jgi:uncharacterized protein (DUF1330 family)